MWFEELDGAEHTEPADVSRKASNIVFFPATKHVTEMGTRGSPAPAATPQPLFPFAHAPAPTRAHAPPRRLSSPVALFHRRINYLSGRRLSEEFISQERQKVSRSRGVALKLFIVCSLLWSLRWLSPILFCQPATRAPVSLHPISDSGKDCK